jgi:hypothetical protein
MIALALAAARYGESELHALLDTLPAPIYTTDADGWITYFNPACTDFAGRTPTLGEDRWCVTWKLYTQSGVHLPHEDCPMAVAIKESREVRGAIAVARSTSSSTSPTSARARPCAPRRSAAGGSPSRSPTARPSIRCCSWPRNMTSRQTASIAIDPSLGGDARPR